MKRMRVLLIGILLILPFIIILESGCGDQGSMSPTSTFEETPGHYEGGKDKSVRELKEDTMTDDSYAYVSILNILTIQREWYVHNNIVVIVVVSVTDWLRTTESNTQIRDAEGIHESSKEYPFTYWL